MAMMSTMCCRHWVHVSYNHASTSARRSSAVNVVVSVTYMFTIHLSKLFNRHINRYMFFYSCSHHSPTIGIKS